MLLSMIGNMKVDFRNSLHRYVIIIAALAISTMLSSCGEGTLTPTTSSPAGEGALTPITSSPAVQAKLAWDPPDISTDVTGYMIHYGTEAGSYSQSIDVGNTTSYTVSNLIAGQTYYFAVTAYNNDVRDQSTYSNEVSTMAAP